MGSVVSGITGALGLGGATGTGPNAQSANILNPVTAEQATAANTQAQDALMQQQNFVQALQAQNGLGNQTNVFNQLQNQANGVGPNPAQAQLANATGANVANQAALMAGQRGAAVNPALIARQAAMQGANIQQQAAGQGAALQAQQSQNALGQMGALANQQAAQQMQGQNAYTQGTQGYQQNLLSGVGAQNNANVGMQSNINSSNAGMQQAKDQAQGNMFGNLMGAAGTAAMLYGTGGLSAAPALAGGTAMAGMPDMPGAMATAAQGGAVNSLPMNAVPATAPRATLKDYFSATNPPMMAHGGKVPALVSPGEVYLDPKAVSKVTSGANPIATGEKIPGTPKVKGNSLENDTVPKALDPGGIVIPNSIMQSKDPSKKAAEFVAAIMKRQGLDSKKQGSKK